MSQPAVDSFLQLAFRRLLDSTLVAERRLASERAALARGEDVARTAPELVRGDLVVELERQKIDARPAGYEPGEPVFQQAQHIMAITADAVLKDVPWDAGNSWPALAEDYPPPDGAGPTIGDQIELLLEDASPDVDLVQLYLLASESGVEAPRDSIPRLLEVLAVQLPEVESEPEHLFPAAYRRQQLRGRTLAIADSKPWLIALLVIVALMLLVSVPLWWDGINELMEEIGRIREHGRG